MKQYLNKEVVMTFTHPVGYPDGSAANLVQGVITEHNHKEDSITVAGITICYRTNPLMSICLSAAEQYRGEPDLPCRLVEVTGETSEIKSWLLTAKINGMEIWLEIDEDGDIAGSVTKNGITKCGDLRF